MKNILFVSGALCALSSGLACAPVHAQPLPSQKAETKSGYELFLEARALIKDGPNGEPFAEAELAPAENLRLQRLGTTRNAPALAKLRAALKANIIFPDADFLTPENAMELTNSNAAVRAFARTLWQEGAVRAADGDAVAAAQSSLDAFDLSSQAARGLIVNSLLGTATASIARKSLAKNLEALDAAQLRDVANKWERIAARMPSYSQTLRGEERNQLTDFRRNYAAELNNMDDPTDPIEMVKMLGEMMKSLTGGVWTEEELGAMKDSLTLERGLTAVDVESDLHIVFDKALARAAMPYAVAVVAPPIRATTPPMLASAQTLNAPAYRFFAERALVDNRTIIAAMRLRAIKLESGQYPATFDAGVDVFSPTLSPLVYKRASDSYVLYSVGPDGVDNDGAGIQTAEVDAETGAKSVSARLAPNSTGDIVASVL